MYCTKCGTLNDDNAYRCTGCDAVMRRAPDPRMAGRAGEFGGPVKTYLAQSIVVTILCCMPAGIVAIVYSAMAMSKNSEGNYEAAAGLAKKAGTWAWVSFGVGIVGSILYVLAVAAGNGP